MTSLASYVLAGLIVVLATDYFNPIVKTDPASFGAISADKSATISMQVVDRSHKSDRLDRPDQSALAVREFQPLEVHPVHVQVFHRPDPRPLPLPVGCDALAGPLAGSPLPDLAGRCLTDNSDRQRLARADSSAGRFPGI